MEGERERHSEWKEDVFNEREQAFFGSGWFVPIEHREKGTRLDDLFPHVILTKCCITVKGAIVHIPGSFWPVDSLWWKDSKYKTSLQEKSKEEMANDIALIGKVVSKTQP